METVRSEKFGSRDGSGLMAFLRYAQERARTDGRARLASISLRVRDLDPLAVLQAIHEPGQSHLYLERRSVAVSGAEAVVETNTSGEGRFAEAADFVREWSSRILATGDLDGWFSGPLFFQAFSFSASSEPAATIFVPRWQICRTERECIAVANVKIEADTPLELEAGRILRAHESFSDSSRFLPETSEPLGDVRVECEPPELFRDRVKGALGAIEDGKLSKVVLSRWMDLRAERDFLPLEALRGLRESYPDCYAFSYSRGRGASWIGATPEKLIRLMDGRFETEALAGSAPRGLSLAEDTALGNALLASDKDLREHQHVVGAIRAAIEKLGMKAEAGHHPHLLRLSNVQHLRTPITGSLAGGVSLMDLAAALHPTPAVGGVPSNVAEDWIERAEPFERRLFTGFLGWQKPTGEGEAVVALRTARMRGAAARLYAGAGIVAGSDPDRELRETEIKLSAMAKGLGAR